MVRDDFAVIILSHGRANNVKTLDTLNETNYTGKWYIVIDDGDSQMDDYIRNFGEEHILIFNKRKMYGTFDTMDNFTNDSVTVFSRNIIPVFAEKLGLSYFLELDDDYTCFRQRYEDNGVMRTRYVTDFDLIVEPYLEFLDASGAMCVAFAQTGDFIGGLGSLVWRQKLTRKAMNAFFCKVDRPFKFLGRFNDDVNAYIDYGKRGQLFFTARDMCIDQPQTQANAGGITEAYLQYGTYVKSFYSVMLCPSSVKIDMMGDKHPRIHHNVDWEKSVPKIISERFRNV